MLLRRAFHPQRLVCLLLWVLSVSWPHHGWWWGLSSSSSTTTSTTTITGLAAAADTPDLYGILGVSRKATPKEIKKAYRRKALDTHPDKNTHLPAEEAAENFRQVSRAFEILSDEKRRRYYDQTGRTEEPQHRQHQHQQQWGSWTFTWNTQPRRKRRLKDRFDVQRAQSRVLHVVSLEQLRTIMLDDDGVGLERSLLVSMVQAGNDNDDFDMEQHVNDEMVFPWPFAGMSSQRIWWEDLLQTVQIRFHGPTHELVQFFGLYTDNDEHDETNTNKKWRLADPAFFMARRGQPLERASFARLDTRHRETLDSWVWQQLQVSVEFVNHHDAPVEVYWIHDTKATLKMTLDPHGGTARQTSMMSHQWWARDARTDGRHDSPGRYKLTENSCLGEWKITNDTSPQTIVIERKTCYDLSGHCAFWKRQGECRRNPNFMGEDCRKTCGFCSEHEDNAANQRQQKHDEF